MPAAPRREDIDPAKLKHHLGDLFILTDKGEHSPFFRLAGTRLCDLFGRELRDRPFSELWPAEKAVFPCRVARGILQHQLPVVFDVEAEDDHGLTPLTFEMLLLPLHTDKGTAPRLLGALLAERPRKIAYEIPKNWARSNHWLMKTIVGTTFEIEGLENIPETGCIFAPKHQSFWDTYALLPNLPDPVYILKRELLWIPLFGWRNCRLSERRTCHCLKSP